MLSAFSECLFADVASSCGYIRGLTGRIFVEGPTYVDV